MQKAGLDQDDWDLHQKGGEGVVWGERECPGIVGKKNKTGKNNTKKGVGDAQPPVPPLKGIKQHRKREQKKSTKKRGR